MYSDDTESGKLDNIKDVLLESVKAYTMYENQVCPDCETAIPQTAVQGESCANCGHVWAWGQTMMNEKPRSCWIILDHSNEPKCLAEFSGWYNVEDAEIEASYIRNQRNCMYGAIEVVDDIVEMTH